MSDIEMTRHGNQPTSQASSRLSSQPTTNPVATDQFAGNSSLIFCFALFFTVSLFSLFFLMTNLDLVSAANHPSIGIMF